MFLTYDGRTNASQRTSKAWRGVDIEKIKVDQTRGKHLFVDWSQWTTLSTAASNMLATALQSTAGTATRLYNTTDGYNYLELDCASSTDNQGESLFFNGIHVVPRQGAVQVIEGEFRFLDIATGPQFFFGFTDSADGTIQMTNDASTATDLVAVYCTGSTGTAGLLKFEAKDGSSSSTITSGIHTFLDGVTVTDGTEWVKIAIRIENGNYAELYINGEEIDLGDLDHTKIPDGTVLRPAMECLSAGTTDPVCHCKWFEVAESC
jgi:hypothetical protein